MKEDRLITVKSFDVFKCKTDLTGKKWIGVLVIIGIFICAVSPSFGEENKKCILPTPDGGVSEPSSPSISGNIIHVAPNFIEVGQPHFDHKQDFSKRVRILINDSTEIFTFFGGYVAYDKLPIGGYVHIWYVNCGIKGISKQPIAAVIQVSHKKPETNNINN